MKLFTIGPVQMYDRTLKIGGQQVPYFRNGAFSDVVLKTKQGLLKLTNSNEGDDIVFLTASGTAAMEATIINCFDENDHLLIINGGSFGHRFCEICDVNKISYEPVTLTAEQELTKEMVQEAKVKSTKKITGVVVNAHESSTGQLYDLKMLSDFAKENDCYFIVDAISSFLADEINCSTLGIDALILSSQKALSLAPGLSLIVLSERMIKERVNTLPVKNFYMDFKSHLLNGLRGQTPFTPAVRLIYELADMVEMLLEIGMENHIKNVETLAIDFRNKLTAIGLEYPTLPLSNAATTVIFPNGGAKKAFEVLDKEHGIIVNPNGGEYADKKFRVSHIGNHTIEENTELVEIIKNVCEGL